MNMGAKMADQVQDQINRMVLDFGRGYIQAVENLHGESELQELAKTAEVDAQFLAAQVACLAVGSALAGYPGTERERQALVSQFHYALNRRT